MNQKIDLRLFSAVLFVLAVLLRLVPHDYNASAVGALAIFLGCFWSAGVGFVVALAAMLVSDVLGELFGIPSMGFYAPWMMLTVYLAMASSALVGRWLVGCRDGQGEFAMPLWAGVPLGAVVSTLVFFLITNFAVWLNPEMSIYPKTLAGLGECYWAAIPFAKNTLLGNLVYSAAFFGGYSFWVAPRTSEADIR